MMKLLAHRMVTLGVMMVGVVVCGITATLNRLGSLSDSRASWVIGIVAAACLIARIVDDRLERRMEK